MTTQPPPQNSAAFAEIGTLSETILTEVQKTIVGKRELLELVQVGLLANGHILFEDFPGLAKTLMANTFSTALGCEFKRIQFTPDLLPSDITGTYIFDNKTSEFKFRPGPIFTNVLLADEINRAPPKTQAALLEAMQERQVTIEGITHPLPRPFIVLATQNPIEYEGTYPLPEAQLDRFLMKTAIGYPSREEEDEILSRRDARKKDTVDVAKVTGPEALIRIQRQVEEIHVEASVRRYMVEIVARTREDARAMVGASPRGSEALLKLSKARAALRGRDYVTPDDVKAVSRPGLSHRIVLKPEARIRGVEAVEIIDRILSEVEVPTV